jgi:hypothetical protein
MVILLKDRLKGSKWKLKSKKALKAGSLVAFASKKVF